MFGNGSFQIMVFGVAILPAFGRRRLHRFNDFGRGAENTFIGPKTGFDFDARLAFQSFRANKGNG